MCFSIFLWRPIITNKAMSFLPSPKAIVYFQFHPETENEKYNQVNPVNPVKK